LDAIIAEAGHEMEGWTLHDLRRTLATGLQKLGIRLEVTESVLGYRRSSIFSLVILFRAIRPYSR
jgi:hypothetical protein